MNQLEDYYTSKMYAQGMPEFKDLEQWQISALENSQGYSVWKSLKALELFRDSVFNALRIPHLAEWLSKFIK